MQQRKLYRSKTDRMLAGVCGGLGDYFNIDATVVRIIFALATLAGFSGVLVYIILMIVIPESPEIQPAPPVYNEPPASSPPAPGL